MSFLTAAQAMLETYLTENLTPRCLERLNNLRTQNRGSWTPLDIVKIDYELAERTVNAQRKKLEEALQTLTKEGQDQWHAVFKRGCANRNTDTGIAYAQELKAKEALARTLSSEEMAKTGDAQ